MAIMPSLVRFLSFLGLLAAIAYAGMFALVSLVEPTQREFVATVPQDRIGKKLAATASPRPEIAAIEDRLQRVEADRLARVLESLQIPR